MDPSVIHWNDDSVDKSILTSSFIDV